MKKALLMGAMALAIVTSMVAGTLAIYSKDFNFGGTVTAAKFYVNASTTEENPNITIAPNETKAWQFNVTNTDGTVTSAVNMSTSIKITLPTGFEDISVVLKDGDGIEVNTGVVDSDGSIRIAGKDFVANTSRTDTYTLEFTWDGSQSNEIDTKLGEAATSEGFSVAVTGTQI